MPRKAICLCALLLLSWLLCSPIYPDTPTVFGPKDLTIKSWPLHLSVHRFRVDEPGEGTMVITKGTANSQLRGGFLLLNRRPLSLHRFLMGGDTRCEADIALGSTNRLLVFLRGSPGASLTIEVRRKVLPPANSPPVAHPQWVTTDEDTPVALSLTGSDPDGDILTYQVTSGPNHGTLTGSPPDLTYTPRADYNGAESFAFQVNDGSGTSPPATVTITVTPVNDPPVASHDVATTHQGRPVAIDVLANDMDIDGDTLTISGFTQPADGTAVVKGAALSYTPAQGFSGTDRLTYTVSDGHGATATATVTVTVISPITLAITSPPDGELICRADVMVHGMVVNATGHETGVTVNGILAIVYGDQFVANHVLLQEGEHTIRAVATDTQGNTATASVTINALPPSDYISLSSTPESGISPLEATLRIDGSLSVTGSALSSTGPGELEVLDSTPEEYRVRMEEVGIYYLTAELTDSEDTTCTDTVAVVVLDRAEVDAALKAKWEEMKEALIAGDIETALSFHHGVLRDKYEAIYTLLGSNLSTLAQQMQDIELIYATGDRAKYRITRDHTIEGQTVTITYYIYFSKDRNGLWKIERY